MDALAGKDYDKYREDANNIIKSVKKAKAWVDKFVFMRDEVTHSSDLEGLSCFMFRKIEIGNSQGIVYYPSLSDGGRVSKYMDEVWLDITNLISSNLSIIVKVVKMRRR